MKNQPDKSKEKYILTTSNNFCQTPVLGLELGVYFTFALDNNDNDNDNNNNPHLNFWKGTVLGVNEEGLGLNHNDNDDNGNDNDNNPHLNFLKGTVLGVKEQGLRIRDKR